MVPRFCGSHAPGSLDLPAFSGDGPQPAAFTAPQPNRRTLALSRAGAAARGGGDPVRQANRMSLILEFLEYIDRQPGQSLNEVLAKTLRKSRLLTNAEAGAIYLKRQDQARSWLEPVEPAERQGRAVAGELHPADRSHLDRRLRRRQRALGADRRRLQDSAGPALPLRRRLRPRQRLPHALDHGLPAEGTMAAR